MDVSQNVVPVVASRSKVAGVTRKAALSVAVAAAIGGAVFAPATAAFAATGAVPVASHATTDGCGDCYPDVM